MSSFNPNNHISRPTFCHNVILTIFLFLCNVPGFFFPFSLRFFCVPTNNLYAFICFLKWNEIFFILWTAQKHCVWDFCADAVSVEAHDESEKSENGKKMWLAWDMKKFLFCRCSLDEWKSFLESRRKESSSPLFLLSCCHFIAFLCLRSREYYFSKRFFLSYFFGITMDELLQK